VVTLVLTLLSPGGPIPAIGAALGVDARTVAAWLSRAGQHCQQGQPHLVQQGQVALQHGQADALWGKRVGGRVCMALALAVPSRLWLGGGISPHRDWPLLTTLVQRSRACARPLAIVVCVDGWASSVTAGLRVFRPPVRTGRRGRPRLVVESGVRVGHVVKHSVRRRVVRVERRVIRGPEKAIAAGVAATQTGTGINTADIARLNAPFRASLAPLVRRGRALAHTAAGLAAGLWRVGWAYTCCWWHESLRQRAPVGAPWTWQERTPAMAARLPAHRWTMRALVDDQGPLPAWGAPKRRGRPPKRALQPAIAVAT
jgi:hypothetical protein